ncbi:TetR/AcrR family transcriptional regulator [Streptomyces aureoverticillatus]|uniref:TetR/AcrR family transcriptional regulator n=1 Tax=Streptomyces aureoverticillatus TaxID=66871 RepID=UPI0013DC1534|nr:TetR/AcrR family transcriptional regulator [Streptomyces aureoverticillatus]QIB44434.1 TetR/AcrR family transcriptional regulator [Streptomyces aureoverticillatus]
MPAASRRERHRTETTAEIKATALKHLVEEGAESVALRGIARDMGMAPGTFYSYFDTREALLSALAADAYRDLAAHLREARDAHPPTAPAARALAHGLAYRAWALAHPQEFRLLFSGRAQTPHTNTPESTAAEYELCLGIVEIAATAAPAPSANGSSTGYTWEDFAPDFTTVARATFPTLTPPALALSLRVWGRMHGLVTLEIDGLLRPQIDNPDTLYRDELADLVRGLGLTPTTE